MQARVLLIEIGTEDISLSPMRKERLSWHRTLRVPLLLLLPSVLCSFRSWRNALGTAICFADSRSAAETAGMVAIVASCYYYHTTITQRKSQVSATLWVCRSRKVRCLRFEPGGLKEEGIVSAAVAMVLGCSIVNIIGSQG